MEGSWNLKRPLSTRVEEDDIFSTNFQWLQFTGSLHVRSARSWAVKFRLEAEVDLERYGLCTQQLGLQPKIAKTEQGWGIWPSAGTPFPSCATAVAVGSGAQLTAALGHHEGRRSPWLSMRFSSRTMEVGTGVLLWPFWDGLSSCANRP